MKTIGRILLKGLLTILPIGLTLYFVYWLGVTTESLLSGPLKWVLPEGFYRPGMGLVAGFLVLFAVFGVFPLLFSLVLAFHTWEPASGLESMTFVGLENFAFAIEDEWFWKSLGNTGWLALASGLPQHLVAIPLAVFIHRSIRRWRVRAGVIRA